MLVRQGICIAEHVLRGRGENGGRGLGRVVRGSAGSRSSGFGQGAARGNALHAAHILAIFIPRRARGDSGVRSLWSSIPTSLLLPLRLAMKVLRVRSPRSVLLEFKDATAQHPLKRTHEVVHAAQLVGERLQELLVVLSHTPDGLGLTDLGEMTREDGPALLVDAPLDARGHCPVLVSVRRHYCCCVNGACVR